MIAESIKKIAQTTDEVYSLVCEVVSVNKTSRTCDLRPLNGDAEIFDVRLQAKPGNGIGLCLFPAPGSTVVATFINKSTAYVALCEEVQEVVLKIGDKEIVADASGVSYGSSSVDFANQVNSLLSELSLLTDTILSLQLTVVGALTTGATGSSVAQIAAHKAKFAVIKTQLSTLLN